MSWKPSWIRVAEDLGGLFSGLDPETGVYDPVSGHWGYEGSLGDRDGQDSSDEKRGAEPDRVAWISPEDRKGIHGYAIERRGPAARRVAVEVDVPSRRPAAARPDPAASPLCLPDPEAPLLPVHAEMVSQVCGCSPEQFTRTTDFLCSNSGRERTSVLVYALGWRRRATGTQMIRAGGILQLLPATWAAPGGGILAMRGHSSIRARQTSGPCMTSCPAICPSPGRRGP